MAPVSRRTVLAALAAMPALAAVGCGGGGAPPASGGGRTSVRFAMDWTPNTNHTGLYAAQQQGWFADAGLDVQILPYNSTSPDTLVSSGAAEFGISFQDSFTVSKAAGADIVSVLAVLQHWGTAIAVRADRADLRSPRDLDGKAYGGFGAAYEVPKMQAIIRAAGGKGDFKNVVLGTSAYEALYAGQVDFTEPFLAWEGIEAELRNEPLKTFAYADFKFPDAYSVIVIGNPGWMKAHPDAAAAFVGALQRGYQLGADDPAQRYLKDATGKVGTQTAATWSGFSGFLYDAGVLAGADGKPLTARPDFATWFTAPGA